MCLAFVLGDNRNAAVVEFDRTGIGHAYSE